MDLLPLQTLIIVTRKIIRLIQTVISLIVQFVIKHKQMQIKQIVKLLQTVLY